ncbi:hypothetical protein ABIE45_000959 [Methylobacterium sp. OAE515]
MMQAHEDAIAYLDLLIATKKQHAAEDEAERRATGGAGGASFNRSGSGR